MTRYFRVVGCLQPIGKVFTGLTDDILLAALVMLPGAPQLIASPPAEITNVKLMS
jgi:hypothetical protein